MLMVFYIKNKKMIIYFFYKFVYKKRLKYKYYKYTKNGRFRLF